MRYLRDCEKNNIYNIEKIGGIFAKYLNSFVKVIIFIIIIDTVLMFVLFKNHFDIKTSIIIAGLYSIVAIALFVILYLGNKVFIDIEKNKIDCLDANILNKREDLDKVNNTNTYYITVNIDGKDIEIEYNGKDFNNLKSGDKIVLIEYMFLNKKSYLCYSYNEINKI